MFPNADSVSNANQKTNIKNNIGKSYIFDFKTGDFELQDGKLIFSDENTALKIWIEKVLRTEKNRYVIYDNTAYGCQLEDLIIGSNFPVAFIESELRREIEDALTQHPKIIGISDFYMERLPSSVKVDFRVVLINGESFEQEVAFGG